MFMLAVVSFILFSALTVEFGLILLKIVNKDTVQNIQDRKNELMRRRRLASIYKINNY